MVLTEKELNILRGKTLTNHITQQEILKVFGHIDMLELFLDERDQDDAFGTEGWRHSIGMED